MALSVPVNSPAALRCGPRIIASRSQRQLNLHRCLLSSKSHHHRLVVTSIKVSAAEHFAEPSDPISHQKNLVDSLWNGCPKPLKQFPWENATDLVVKRLLFLGQEALKWSIVLLFTFSFISDITFAVTSNNELLVPFGLFIGVILADFIKESSIDFFRSNIKDPEFIRHLLFIGCFFTSVKFIAWLFNTQGQLLLCHIGNGGLMQVLWLASRLQQTENVKHQDKQTLEH